MAASLAAKTRRSSGLLRCGFAGWGLLLVDAIVRNSGGREHPLPRRVHDDVPGGEVRRISIPRTRVNNARCAKKFQNAPHLQCGARSNPAGVAREKVVAVMRRTLLVLTVALVMAAMVAASALPVAAQGEGGTVIHEGTCFLDEPGVPNLV